MKRERWLRLVLGCVPVLLLTLGTARAQEITVRPQPSPPPPPAEFRLEPLQPGERVSIPEQEFHPELQFAEHAPALVHPIAGKARVGPGQVIRFGLSIWTGPHEVGRGISQVERNGGVLAVGFSLAWGASDEGTPAGR